MLILVSIVGCGYSCFCVWHPASLVSISSSIVDDMPNEDSLSINFELVKYIFAYSPILLFVLEIIFYLKNYNFVLLVEVCA